MEWYNKMYTIIELVTFVINHNSDTLSLMESVTTLLYICREKVISSLTCPLYNVYSFCSTSISVKVSIISPSMMSLKLTRLKPHSMPIGTSFTSSL